MEKYGVDINPEHVKTSEEKLTTSAKCARCGALLEKVANVPKCPQCGTEPYESKKP
jgi:exosome complex RNA-binding protein Csl4